MTHDPRNPPQAEPADVPSLIAEAVHRSGKLVQNEIELAKRELAGKARSVFAGIMMILVALFLVFSALDVLTAAAVAGLAEAGMPVSAASLLVAAIVLIVAVGLFLAGKSRLDPKNLKLDRSARSVRKDIDTMKEKAHV